MASDERARALELVRRLMNPSGETEAEQDEWVAELERLVPDPAIMDLIYWPQHHKLSKDLPEAERTPEKVVELAYQYKSIAL